MTKEDILLKDLCARLPYGVIIQYKDFRPVKMYSIDEFTFNSTYLLELAKPYLRPMSSMTEEEKKQFYKFICIDVDAWIGNGTKGYINQSIIMSDGIDYLNSIHIDYRGLIPKGLAIGVTKENNPYKE